MPKTYKPPSPNNSDRDIKEDFHAIIIMTIIKIQRLIMQQRH